MDWIQDAYGGGFFISFSIPYLWYLQMAALKRCILPVNNIID